MVADESATPLKEELEQSACKNPHGFGFAIIAGDRIISERTMNAERSIKRFLAFRAQYPEGHALWHARIATHGAQNEANCHPFRVGGDRRTYLGHNGVLRIPMMKDEHRSDSRVFAEDGLPSLGGVSALDDPFKRTLIEDWADYNKIAILTVDPDAIHPLYIINEKGGKWDDNGVWWSNQTHIKPKVYESGSSWSSWEGKYKPTNYYTAHNYDIDTQVFSLKADWRYDTLSGGYVQDTPTGSTLQIVSPYTVKGTGDFMVQCRVCERVNDTLLNDFYCQQCCSCLECNMSEVDCLCYNESAWKNTGY